MIIGFVSEEARESYYASRMESQARLRSSSSSSSSRKQRIFRYSKSPAVAISLSTDEINELAKDPNSNVQYVQHESQWHLIEVSLRNKLWAQTELLPYGIGTVQGLSKSIPSPKYRNGTCTNTNSFKICVIDTGLYVAHYDIPYQRYGADIEGMTMGLDSNRKWYHPTAANSHGTHVTGTILAKGKNGKGVIGIIPNKKGICLLVAQVYDARTSQDSSVVTEAMEWCHAKGARIINLSAGGTERPPPADEATIHRLVNEDGILFVASAGNRGSSVFTYPASLSSVISVGALTPDNRRASFSQYNSQVDLVAPGVDILSTVVSHDLVLNENDTEDRTVFQAVLMQYSVDIPKKLRRIPLDMMYCGKLIVLLVP